MHYDVPDEDFGFERPAYEGVPPVVEGDLVTMEGPFGTTFVIHGIVVDPATVEPIPNHGNDDDGGGGDG
jgi:hypothetical protein